MTHLGYLIAGWGIGLGSLGIYGLRVLHRGRTLAGQVPEDRQRWMSTDV